MGYFEHMCFALLNSFLLAFSSLALFIHAFAPFIFTTTASSMMERVSRSLHRKIGDRILVRFNTKWREDPQTRQWRVLVNGVESLARKVLLKTRCETIEENIDGEQKFHFLCFGSVNWNGTDAEII